MRLTVFSESVYTGVDIESMRKHAGSEDGCRGKPCNIMIYIRSIYLYTEYI